MRDLAAFLLARIAEDEAVARQVQADDAAAYQDYLRRLPPEWRASEAVTRELIQLDSNLQHLDEPASMIAIDPTRVLAECEAKRRIVAWCSQTNLIAVNVLGDPTEPANYVPGPPVHPSDAPVLRLLAVPYADHPAYRQEWAP